jgi:hypothetical protein
VIIINEWMNNAEVTDPAWEKSFEISVASDGKQPATQLSKGQGM